MSTITLARKARMRACRLAASWSGATLLLIGLRGADPLAAQQPNPVAGCPSFHEVHAAMSAEEALRDYAPPGFKVYPGTNEQAEKHLLRRKPVVSGGEIDQAWIELHRDKKDQVVVRFRFNVEATRRFGDFTTRNVGYASAVVLDGRAISFLTIKQPILDGVGVFDGGFTGAEARQLVDRINSGACRSSQ
jgi:preprotein translocase subunit SecD